MASILNAKTVVSPGAPSSRPSKIPVRTGYSSGSASDDSDSSSKSESKSRTGGKSRLPVPVRSKPGQTSGIQSDPEKNSVKGVEEKVVPATGNAGIENKDNDTAAEPIKKMPARLKSLKMKKISSVNQARCDPLSRTVIPGINKKQVPATPSSDALAFMQQGRLRPARKFQPKKTPGTEDSSEEEYERPSGGIARRTSYRNMHSPDEQKPKPTKKVSTVGLKDPKNTSASSSKSNERPSSISRIGTKNTTKTSKVTKGAKSDRKNKESDASESENSLGLKPRKISLNYEAESDDPVSTVSEASCASMEAKSKNNDETEHLTNTLGYDEAYDVVSTVSEASCAPMEAESKNDDGIERLTNTLGYDEAYDVVSTDSEASYAPMEAKSHDTNNNEPFMADIQWLRDRNIEFEDCSDFSTTDSISEKPPQKDQIQVEKLAQPSVPDIQTEDHKDDQASEKQNEEDILSDSFWDVNPNKPEQSKDQPESGPREEPVKDDKSKVDKDSTDEGSFIDELEELLSASEAEIEASNASQHQQIVADDLMPAPIPNLCIDGMINASNETNNTTGQQSGSQNHEPSGEGGSNRKEVTGESGKAQGSSVGGSGDGDDPNDPKKPKPSKEPDDKKDEDDETAKERAAKEAVAKERMENTDGEGFLQEVKATQTGEEGNVAALYKAIRSRDNEIGMMNKLVENCRHDYEELQGNFDKYTNDFKEVDANRIKISTLTHENKFLKEQNSLLKSDLFQAMTEANQANEERKEVKVMLSKMEVDFDFLVTEKKELLTKLKLYEANTPPEQVDTQKADHKQESKKSRVKQQLGKCSSLQDIEAMKAEEELELKNKPHHSEKASKESEEIKQLKKTITAFQEKLLEDVTQIKQMKSRIESSEAERERLEKDLRKTEEQLAETVAYKDREISNLMKDNDKKEQKNEELTSEIRDVLKGNDYLRNTLQTWYQKYDQKDDTEKELRKSIDDLETENENLLKELSEQRLKLLDARREKIENEDIPRTELESLQNALKMKIATITDVISNIEDTTTNDSVNGAQLFSSDLELALQLLYDIYELLKTKGKAFMKTIGCPCSCNGQKPGPSTEKEVQRNDEMAGEEHNTLKEDHETSERDSRLDEQESLMDDLRERIKILTQENNKLEKKVKKRKVTFSEDTQGGESDDARQLQKELKEKELQIAEMEEEMIRVRAESDMLADYAKDAQDQADHDIESLTSQNEMKTNHIKRLQNDCANQRIIAKNLQEELSECVQKNVTLNKMLKDVEEERQELQEKLKAVKDSESTRQQTEIHLNHIQKLQEDCEKQRLISKNLKDELAELKKKNASLDAMVNGNSRQEQDLQQALTVKSKETEEHLEAIQKLQEEFEQQRLTAKTLSDELSELKETNESLDKKLKEVEMEKEIIEEKLETVKDAESFRRQTDIHLDHIQKLQKDGENQRLCVKKLKSQVFELENSTATLDTKLKDAEAEKFALELKLKALTQEIQKDAVMEEASTSREGCVSRTPSTGGEREEQIQELQEVNEKLGEKIDMYEAFFEQVKEDKAQSKKALEASRQDIMMLKKKSDEKIAELEKILTDKNGLETNLQDTVTSLEKRISVLEAEKADHESELKAMAECLQRHHELEETKDKWKELESELRRSITTLTTEKSEAQKELEEQKSVATKASESLAIRMKELDKCQQERQDLKEELECLKSTNTELKEEMAKKLTKTGQDVDQRLAELKLLKHSSSEIISELEKQLKDRRDSEIKLKERATTLNQQIVQLEAEKLQSDKKIRALTEFMEVKESKAKHRSIDEVNELNEKLSSMEAKMSELAKEKQKAQQDIALVRKESEMKLTTLEKCLKDQRDSGTMLEEKIQSLELRISQLTAEKEERDERIKTLLEAINANKNLEEQLKKKEELEANLSNKVEELRLKFSRIKSTKNKLERQLLKQRSEISTLSSKPKQHRQEYQDQMDELNERLQRLSERESQARLAKQSADNEIRVLEQQLLSKGQSEQDDKERMASLEEKIARLEIERSQHCKNISSIIRKLKTKEDLADAIAARNEAQQEYNIKMDEMEIIVNKLRMENRREDCNEELKEKYKMEYEESRSNVRKSTEKLNRWNEKVKEMQEFITGADEDLHSQDTQEISLHENIERLKERLKASDTMDLFQTLQSLKEKISRLEAEKADEKKIVTALLKSIEDKEASQMQQRNMTEVMRKFSDGKKLIEDELQDSEKLRAAKESESELINTQTDKRISVLQQSEREIRKRLENMSEKLVQLESSKEETNKTIQTMLESLQWKDNLEQWLDEKELLEKELKRRMQEFKLENKEALVEAKKYRVQCRDMHKMKDQITSLKEQLLQMECSKEKAIKSLEKLLEEKDEHLKLVKRSLKDEVLKLKLEKKDLEIEKKQSQMETRNAFELIKKQSDDFDEILNKRNESSERMMAEIENLKQSLSTVTAERDELDEKAKKYAQAYRGMQRRSREDCST